MLPIHQLIHFGNWNKELTGIWVSKFEASRTDATFLAQGIADNIKSVPNVKAITDISINEAYNYCLQLNASMDSHLMKNSEWGAVAYLAYSAYGRSGNKVKPNLSSDMITGGGTSSNGATYATTSETIFQNRYGYKTSAGMKASTTGNIYGIYDFVGGALEYVSAYVNNGESEVATNGGSLQNASTLYLSQAYSEGASDTSTNNYEANASVRGDGIYEVSLDGTYAWGSNEIDYPSGNMPFFARGGSYYSNYNTTGIFEVAAKDGVANESISFRIVLAP